MNEPKCHFDNDRGWLTPEHVRDCTDRGCRGCKPCGKSHCGMRDRCGNHVEQHAGIFTCPSCIGKTRRQVKRIAERYAELPDEYDFEGVDSEVVNLHGPAASPEQYAERKRRLLKVYEGQGWCEFPKHHLVTSDPHHPYGVLGRWDIAIRESYNQPTDLFVTVSRAVDYLAGDILDTFAHTQEFEDFARDINACLTHLEDVLALSKRPEQGAPCPTCRAASEDRKAPRLLKRYGNATDGSEDTWHCPREAAHWWSHRDYRNRVDSDFLDHATELTASQMHERYSIKPGTLRKWAERGHVKKRGLNAQGQQLYDVAGARAMADHDQASA